MSVHIFSVSHRKVTRAQAKVLERIAKENDCDFIEVSGRQYQNGYQSWFSGPDVGFPFTRSMEESVATAVRKAGIER